MRNTNTNKRTANCKRPFRYFGLEIIISMLVGYIAFMITAHILFSATLVIVMMISPLKRLDYFTDRCNAIKKYNEYQLDIRTKKGFM